MDRDRGVSGEHSLLASLPRHMLCTHPVSAATGCQENRWTTHEWATGLSQTRSATGVEGVEKSKRQLGWAPKRSPPRIGGRSAHACTRISPQWCPLSGLHDTRAMVRLVSGPTWGLLKHACQSLPPATKPDLTARMHTCLLSVESVGGRTQHACRGPQG